VGLDTTGTSTGLGKLGINVNLVPMANLGVDIGASLSPTGTPMLNGVDSSVWAKIDKSTLRVGYLYTTNGTVLYAPAAPTNGGVYFSYDLTF